MRSPSEQPVVPVLPDAQRRAAPAATLALVLVPAGQDVPAAPAPAEESGPRIDAMAVIMLVFGLVFVIGALVLMRKRR